MIDNQIHTMLRPLEHTDFDQLVCWLNAPHVLRWWDGEVDADAVLSRYGPRLSKDSPTRVYVIEAGALPVGIVQCYRHAAYPDWDRAVGIQKAAGIDYLIGDVDSTGKGIGSNAIRLIAQIAFDLYPEVDVIVSAPQKANLGSCKAIEKAGFSCIDERKLDSNCPSDSGISSIYVLHRPGSVHSAIKR